MACMRSSSQMKACRGCLRPAAGATWAVRAPIKAGSFHTRVLLGTLPAPNCGAWVLLIMSAALIWMAIRRLTPRLTLQQFRNNAVETLVAHFGP